MPRLPLPPRKRVHSREHAQRLDPYYGYGYNPCWPSILSVAHDESDGGSLFVIFDRPVVLPGAIWSIPLLVPDGSPLAIIDAAMVLPVKLRVSFNGAVPQGAAWRWSGVSSVIDPITGHAPNPGAGYCADHPGPFTPPVPASVINATTIGYGCQLEFDRPIVLASTSPDGSILFDGIAPIAVGSVSPTILGFETTNPLSGGSTWQIDAQPAFARTPISLPQSGTFPFPPPPPPVNITSVVGTEGLTSGAINFDAPVTLAEGAVPDDAMLFGGLPALEVMQNGPTSLGVIFQVPGAIGVTPWEIARQPAWIATPVVFPNSGVLAEP